MRTSASNLRSGAILEDHDHDWHQLIYVAAGVVRVSTEMGSWVAPPTWAIWVPAGVRHGLRFLGEGALRTAYFRPEWRAGYPSACAVVSVTPLLRELIVRATEVGMLDRRDPTEKALAMLVVAELRQSDAPPFRLPQPVSEALSRATVLMATRAVEAASVAALAHAVGMGTRTFERRFFAETGMTPGRWRQQKALLGGLEQIAGGMPVKAAAAQAGYATSSAFIAAFRSSFDTTPGRYFAL